MPTNYRGTSQERFALDACIKITRAVSTLERYLERSAGLGDLTQSQFGVLDILYHLGTQSQKAIGEKLLQSGGNITLVIDNLEKKGFVRRMPAEHDRRVTLVILTERGRTVFENLLPSAVSTIVRAFSGLSPLELDTLAKLSKKLGLSLVERMPQ